MSNKKAWVDGPFMLIPASASGDEVGNRATGARAMAVEMTLIHNVIIRGANAIYLQCINVGEKGTDEDKVDFANFAARWCEAVHEHHSAEEETFFPGINKLAETPGLMDGNVTEHEEFHAGLESFTEYVTGVADGKDKYDGQQIKDLIDSFMPSLSKHLASEISSLLVLCKWDNKIPWKTWFEGEISTKAKELMAQQRYRTHVFPIVLILHDKTYENGLWESFPPIPWIAAVILRVLFIRVHSHWWRFAGCDSSSMPKDLPFA